MLVLAFSGGKDSTAMALRMAELGEFFTLLFNATGDELDDLLDHVRRVRDLTGMPLAVTSAGFSLAERIRWYESLPNQNMRWCTRELKIEPTVAWLDARPGSVLCVGLRADEDGREGAATLYGPAVTYRRPLREWGWGKAEVVAYLKGRGVVVPERTDCAICYDQRLSEWWKLWRKHPERFEAGVALEGLTGHTFRSPSRDTWPADLASLRERFEAGDVPTRGKHGLIPMPLFGDYDEKEGGGRCRVCRN